MQRNKLICMIGLPRSGKSTEAKVLNMRYNYPIVNPDSIRLGIYNQSFIAQLEDLVWFITKATVCSHFVYGYETVVLDATNINKKSRKMWYKNDMWTPEWFYINTPVDICIERATRSATDYLIPIITRMATQFEPLTEEEGKTYSCTY